MKFFFHRANIVVKAAKYPIPSERTPSDSVLLERDAFLLFCIILCFSLSLTLFTLEALAKQDNISAVVQKASLQKGKRVLRFEHIGLEQGLSQNSIYALKQDRSGFLWIGTEDGLNRYDGYRMTTFRHDPAKPQSLSANFVQVIHEDRNGNLWVGTEMGGLNRYYAHTENFTRFQAVQDNPNTLSNNSIRCIAEASNGEFWIGTAQGLNLFNPVNGRVKQYPVPQAPVPLSAVSGSTPSAVAVNALVIDKQGIIWCGTWGGGISRLDPKTGVFTYFRHNPDNTSSLSDNFVRCIEQDSSGVFWIGTLRGGLTRFDPTSGTVNRFPHDAANPESLPGNDVRSIRQENEQTLWLATVDGGLGIFDKRTGKCTNYKSEQTNSQSLQTNILNTIAADRAGTVWIGTGGSGLEKFDPCAWKFVSHHREINNPNSLSHNVVRAFFEDKDCTVWIATEGGLNRYHRPSGTFTHFLKQTSGTTYSKTDIVKGKSIAGNGVRVVHRDKQGRLWIGTVTGFQELDEQRGTFTTYPVRANLASSPNTTNALPSESVRVLLENDDGTMWLGTEGGGVCLFDPEAKTFRIFDNDPENPRSLSHNVVISLYRDRKGTLWVGTLGGLNKYNPATQDFTVFLRDPNNPNSLNSNNIRSMYDDEQGRFWIGTWGGGLHLFDRETGYCEVFRERDGLPNDAVYGILPDSKGFLWLTTNRGLARFHPAHRTFRIYDADDGLQSNEFNGGAYYQGKSGRMYVGGVNGFSEFFPDSIRDNEALPQVVITGMKKFNKHVQLGTDLRHNPEITLHYDDKFFTIEFAALNFTHSRKNRYLYKLEGFDKAWIDAGTSREAAYTNLDAGAYVFCVKASNNDGRWNEEGAKLRITILPPWWMTLWFRCAIVLSLVSSGGVWFWNHLRRVDAQKRELERLVRKRTQELESMNESLTEANHEIEQHIQTVSEQAWEIATMNTQLQARNGELETLNKEKDEFLGIAAHDLKNPLTSIVLSTEMLQYNMGSMPQERAMERLRQIESTAMRMRDIVSDLLDMNALESGRLTLRMDACDAAMLAEEVVAEYRERAAEKAITLHLDYDADVMEQSYIYADYAKAREVLENLVSNAVKYSPLGKQVFVRLRSEGETVKIIVQDEGQGLTEEDKSQLFQRFTRLSATPTAGEHSSGLGLSIAKKLIESMRGNICCESEYGNGATFIIEFQSAASVEAPPIHDFDVVI